MKSHSLEQFAAGRYSSFTYNKTDYLRITCSIPLLPRKGRILDVGCGDGQIGKLIKKQSHCEIYGVDISEKSLEIAKRNGLKVKRANVERKFPFASSFFNGVYASEIIEHLIDPGAFISEAYRVLTKEGTLVLTTPNFIGLGSRISVLLGQTPWMMNNRLDSKSSGHIRYFRPQELVMLLQDHGFRNITVKSDTVRLQPIINSQLLAQFVPNFGLHIIISAQKK